MKGSGKSLQQKKEELFDEYERFCAIGNESIHDYFVRFHKLINDMKITQLDIPAHQMNTKFVNNLPPYWAKYVTNVKNNKDISATTYVELYTYLKSYEPHAIKTLKKQEQSSSIVDPLAYLATTSLTPPSQPPAQSSNDAMLETMNQIVNLLSGFQKQFPLTNNQLKTSSNLGTHATMHDGKIITEPVQRRAPGNVGNTGNRGTKSYGQMTDNKGKKVICYNCRGEGHVAMQCKEKRRAKDSQYFKDKMLLMEAKEKGAVLDAEAEAFLTDDSDVDEGPNATTAFMANLSSTNGASTSHVNEYQIDSEVKTVPTKVSSVSPGEISMITILDDLRTQLDGHLKVNQEQSLVNESLRAELDKCKLEMQSLERNKAKHDLDKTIVQRNKRNAELEQENAEITRTKMSERPGTIQPINYAELNALYSHFVPHKGNCPLKDQLQGKDDTIRNLQTQINITRMLNVGSTVGSFDKQALETELSQLKDAITSVRIQNDGFKVENKNVKRRYKELSETNTHSRDALTSKITALTAENAKLKTELISKISSGSIACEKPKVLALGMYAISPKYIPPQRRVNRAVPTPLPMK
ncbi:integrase, catalytic region, zinc finger, CCHC-type containing protein [Tanacetum coccineum]